MFFIIKQYKVLFTQCILNMQVWWAEWMSWDIDKAVKSSDILTITEYKALLEKYKDNEAELNKAVSESIKDQLYRDGRVLKILKNYAEASENVVNESTTQIADLKEETIKKEKPLIKAEKVINTDIFNRTLKKWMEWSDVMALQEFLILKGLLKPTYTNKSGEELSNADWKFGNWTLNALKAFQKTLGYSNPDGVLTVSNKKTYKTLAAIKALDNNDDYKWSSTNVFARKSSKTEVVKSIEKSSKSLDALKRLNENSDDFYKALEAYYDWWFRKDVISDMWWILWWFEEAVWANNADDYFDKMKTYEDKIGDKEDKFNDELYKILEKKTNKDGQEYTTRAESLSWYAIRDIIIMAVFQDIPLFDIRLNFAKNLVSHWVPMDKARALKDWVDWWMEWEPDYSKENLDNISGKDSLSWLRELRSTLTAYGFSNKQIDFALKWDLEWLTLKQKEVLRVIINDRIIPDLETLRIGWFNFIERWFDDKDGEIKNRLNRLTWKNTNLWTVSDIIDNKNIDITHNVSLRKISDIYVLNVDDWGADTYKVFNKLPTDYEIKKSVTDYANNDESLWSTQEFISVSYDALDNIRGKKNPENETFNIIKKSENEYIVEKDWKFKLMNTKPTQNDINDFYDNKLKWFEETYKQWVYDNNLSINEQLKLTWEIITLLKEQDTEDWFFGTEDWLTEWIQRVDSRYEYTKWINEQRDFLTKSIEILKWENKELFKKFSMISTFWTIEDFFNAFPSNDLEVRWYISALSTAENIETYVDLLKQLNRSKKVSDYFTIVFNAHKNNNWMNAWKNYRLSNIPKNTWLARINASKERQFKYGEKLDINATAEAALSKMKSETTEKWGNTPSKDILWNIVSWMILKAWITDVTSTDLESAITKKWEAIPLAELNANVINTAKWSNYSNDQITTFPKLQFERGDTHAFHTTVEKTIDLYKKNWEKVTVTKLYDIYFRPECNNLLIIPWSNSQISKLNQAEFNMDISNLKTSTLPITLMMLKSVADAITPNKTDSWASSMPIDDTPIDIPNLPNQPAL